MNHNAIKAAIIRDLNTGGKSCVGVHDVWRQRTAYIYFDRGVTDDRQPIAKVFRPDPRTSRKTKFDSAPYHVEIAPGVDIAFIVMFCAALGHAMQQCIGKNAPQLFGFGQP